VGWCILCIYMSFVRLDNGSFNNQAFIWETVTQIGYQCTNGTNEIQFIQN
jgi:hypothetical protein